MKRKEVQYRLNKGEAAQFLSEDPFTVKGITIIVERND
jgi:hypothetical protein